MKYYIGTTLNFVCPGLGDVLYGNLTKGLFTFIAFVLSLTLSIYWNIFFIIVSFIIWFYSFWSIFQEE
ncbi:MAG: hypothetical protein AABW67_00430 [Nanoarchaeota archaeon]